MNETCNDWDVLVSPGWLEQHLGDPGVRVFDCTTTLDYLPPGAEAPYRVVSGLDDYRVSHIPGAAFLDIDRDLSVHDSPPHLRFTLPEAGRLADALAARGVGSGYRIVLYTRGRMQWATRVWWMLRWLGFDDAAVLDGGFERWRDEGRPLASGQEGYPPASFDPSPRSGLFVGRQQVLESRGSADSVLVNALDPELHRGEIPRYGRPGRIAGSVNVPAAALVDPLSNRLLEPQQARRLFSAAGVEPAKRVVLYCGGGIAATLDAFVLHRLGYTDITVYDASLSEWARDHSLPMECDTPGGVDD